MTLRVSVIGAGIGASHCAGYAELPDQFAIHSVCDLNEQRGKALAAEYAADFTTDVRAVLSDPAIDLVDICLPPHLHLNACLDVLDAGKRVICEKPLVSSLRDVDALEAKVKETNGFLSPVFQYRFGTGAAQLRALIDAGLAGKPFAGTLETHWDRPAAYYEVDWRGTWAGEQGGAILGHAIHIHDLLPYLFGPVARVYADLATRVNSIEVEDCAALSIRMQSGALVTSSVTLGCAENISRMRLMFEGFTVESDHAPYALAESAWHFIARNPTRQSQIDEVIEKTGPVKKGYAGMFDAIATTLNGGPKNHVTLNDARRSLEFVTATYASARSGQPVSLPLSKTHPLYDSWLP